VYYAQEKIFAQESADVNAKSQQASEAAKDAAVQLGEARAEAAKEGTGQPGQPQAEGAQQPGREPDESRKPRVRIPPAQIMSITDAWKKAQQSQVETLDQRNHTLTAGEPAG
jgi:hypothetical protein